MEKFPLIMLPKLTGYGLSDPLGGAISGPMGIM